MRMVKSWPREHLHDRYANKQLLQLVQQPLNVRLGVLPYTQLAHSVPVQTLQGVKRRKGWYVAWLSTNCCSARS